MKQSFFSSISLLTWSVFGVNGATPPVDNDQKLPDPPVRPPVMGNVAGWLYGKYELAHGWTSVPPRHNEQEDCAICWTGIPGDFWDSGDAAFETLNTWLSRPHPRRGWQLDCGHKFHLSCLGQCRQDCCPMCRRYTPMGKISAYARSLPEGSSPHQCKNRMVLIMRIAEGLHSRMLTMERDVRIATEAARKEIDSRLKKAKNPDAATKDLSQEMQYRLDQISRSVTAADTITKNIENKLRVAQHANPTVEDVRTIEFFARDLEHSLTLLQGEIQDHRLMRIVHDVYRGPLPSVIFQLLSIAQSLIIIALVSATCFTK